MKSFNRKKLISSLAASAMVAAATLAPLPGLLASNAYAVSPSDFIRITGPAHFISATTVNVPVTYSCAPNPTVPATTESIVVQVTQGLPEDYANGTGMNPTVVCTGVATNTVISVAIVTPPSVSASFSVGNAAASATLFDSNGLLDKGTSQTTTIVP
jgi:hypothetical protein